IESYLPIVPRVRQWKDRKKVVSWPLFPSYVFSRFAPREVSQVLRVPGVVSVVRSNGELVAVSVEDLENVKRFAHALATQQVQPELRPFIAEGQWVRVVGGPFEGVTGLVIERRSRKRVLVGLKAIGQGLEVDIDTRSLVPISGP
ncbi:MAG: transcription termination/antitermination NusG family protein, partial [Longimicrobiales bacterium]